MPAKRAPIFQALSAVLVAALSAAVWLAWMGWDTEYQVDPVTGSQSGPYEAWQVAGCAISLLVLLVVALVTGVRKVLAPTALTIGFTAAWTIQAAQQPDQTGLFVIGATLIFVGVGLASAVVSVITYALGNRRATPSGEPNFSAGQ